jgi:hypothetical protein
MITGTDAQARNAIGVLLYEIGLPKNAFATYDMGPIDEKYNPKNKKEASTGASKANVKFAFSNMGYRNPGEFIKYDYSGVRASIYRDEPVMVAGFAIEVTTTYSSGIQTKSYDEGHYWVIDACAKMGTLVKNKFTGEELPDPNPPDYVHCNLGWGGKNNGWYFSEVFNTNVPTLPIEGKREVGESRFFKYYIEMLIGIRPAN